MSTQRSVTDLLLLLLLLLPPGTYTYSYHLTFCCLVLDFRIRIILFVHKKSFWYQVVYTIFTTLIYRKTSNIQTIPILYSNIPNHYIIMRRFLSNSGSTNGNNPNGTYDEHSNVQLPDGTTSFSFENVEEDWVPLSTTGTKEQDEKEEEEEMHTKPIVSHHQAFNPLVALVCGKHYVPMTR